MTAECTVPGAAFCIVAATGNVLCCRGPIKGWGWNCFWGSGPESEPHVVTFPTAGAALAFMDGKSMFDGAYIGIHYRPPAEAS